MISWPHNLKIEKTNTTPRFLVGLVGLVRGRIKNAIPVMSKARDEIEPRLDGEFFEGAPFETISLIVRVGERTNLTPKYQRTVPGELAVAVELRMDVLRMADDEELGLISKWAFLEALLSVAKKYNRPTAKLIREREKTDGESKYDDIRDLILSKAVN